MLVWIFVEGRMKQDIAVLQQLKRPDFCNGMCRFGVVEKKEKRAGS